MIFSIHALSHLLARRGKAERIGNLLGQLKFSDDQLQQTQRGLDHSGIQLPNFSNVGRELAKEINEEPEVEVETEEERKCCMLSLLSAYNGASKGGIGCCWKTKNPSLSYKHKLGHT